MNESIQLSYPEMSFSYAPICLKESMRKQNTAKRYSQQNLQVDTRTILIFVVLEFQIFLDVCKMRSVLSRR